MSGSSWIVDLRVWVGVALATLVLVFGPSVLRLRPPEVGHDRLCRLVLETGEPQASFFLDGRYAGEAFVGQPLCVVVPEGRVELRSSCLMRPDLFAVIEPRAGREYRYRAQMGPFAALPAAPGFAPRVRVGDTLRDYLASGEGPASRRQYRIEGRSGERLDLIVNAAPLDLELRLFDAEGELETLEARGGDGPGVRARQVFAVRFSKSATFTLEVRASNRNVAVPFTLRCARGLRPVVRGEAANPRLPDRREAPPQ